MMKALLALPDILFFFGLFLNNSDGFNAYYVFWFNVFSLLSTTLGPGFGTLLFSLTVVPLLNVNSIAGVLSDAATFILVNLQSERVDNSSNLFMLTMFSIIPIGLQVLSFIYNSVIAIGIATLFYYWASDQTYLQVFTIVAAASKLIQIGVFAFTPLTVGQLIFYDHI